MDFIKEFHVLLTKVFILLLIYIIQLTYEEVKQNGSKDQIKKNGTEESTFL